MFDVKSHPGYEIMYGLNLLCLIFMTTSMSIADTYFLGSCVHIMACFEDISDAILSVDYYNYEKSVCDWEETNRLLCQSFSLFSQL